MTKGARVSDNSFPSPYGEPVRPPSAASVPPVTPAGTAPAQPPHPAAVQPYPGAAPVQPYLGAAPVQPYPGAAPVQPSGAYPAVPHTGQSSPGYPAPGQQAPHGYPIYGSPAPYGYAPVRPTNGLATTSLVCGIVGLALSWLFVPMIASIVAVITGHMALGQLKRDPRTTGRGFAITGLVLGYVSVGIVIGILLIWFFSFLMIGAAAAPFLFR